MWGIVFVTVASSLTYLVTADITFEACTQDLNGVMIGGRCFFLGPSGTGWGEAWVYCQSMDATLAQIHTRLEFAAVVDKLASNPIFINNAGRYAAWLALQRDNRILGEPCGITSDTTFWYDGPSTPNPKMNAGNTWVRTRACDDNDVGGENCMAVFIKIETLQWVIGDWPCVPVDYLTGYPLCQITNFARNYTQTNACITEEPVETFPTTHHQDCADACSHRTWCHSFNYVVDNSCVSYKCELFSWLSNEHCPGCPSSKPEPSCLHYDSNL